MDANMYGDADESDAELNHRWVEKGGPCWFCGASLTLFTFNYLQNKFK